MKPRTTVSFCAWLFFLAPGNACGPFFPDTVLNHPRAALDVPPVSYLQELYQLIGRPMPKQEAGMGNSEISLLDQIPNEVAELKELWKRNHVEDADIERRVVLYQSVRTKLLAPVKSADFLSFPTQVDQPPDLPARPLGDDFPPDVADYVEGARLHAIAKTEEARALWKSILDRPPEERKLRAMWAAWMLAKTSPDIKECMEWYERVEAEARLGASDAIGLRSAAMAWRAPRLDDPVESVKLLYASVSQGNRNAEVDLRNASRKILTSKDPVILAAAAGDPLVRQLVNIHLHASFDGPREESPDESPADLTPKDWLSALEAHATKPMPDASRVAWALYGIGRHDEARKWLTFSEPNDPLGIWLQAKFDLRDGHLEAANQHLSEAIHLYSKDREWNPTNRPNDFRWFAEPMELRELNQSRLMADAGIVSLAREEYLPALETLRKAGFRLDAAYLAESVISTDGLVRHVRKVAPKWTPGENEPAPLDPVTCLLENSNVYQWNSVPDNQLRYLLARRLAREGRLKEACEFMPPAVLPVLMHYIDLDRARRSGKYSGEILAAITWRQARIHRHLGAELFSTDGAPDGGIYGWSYPMESLAEMRANKDGWSCDWSREVHAGPPEKPADFASPKITSDEISRTRKYGVRPLKRFHYRYVAADLAWAAAKALPPNHPSLAGIYNTAGQWLSAQDPAAADRFYQAMVRRCAKTNEGLVADSKHWFLGELPPTLDLPALPKEFNGSKNSAP